MTSIAGIMTNIIITHSQAMTTRNLMTRMTRATITIILQTLRNMSGRIPPRNTNAITNLTLSIRRVTRTKITALTKFHIPPYKIITIPPKNQSTLLKIIMD